VAWTMIEKIFASHSGGKSVRAGEVVQLRPDVVLLNDVSGPVAIRPFEEMTKDGVFDPDRIVLVADHFSPAKDLLAAELIRSLRKFGDNYGIKNFFQNGIEHAVLAEIGRVYPGALIFGADSHTCTAGALNASGIGFGSTDLAAAMAAGELWAVVPESIRVELVGEKGKFITGKDVILELIRQIGADGAINASIEIAGEGLAHFNIDERFAIANMAVEAGAETCVIEYDNLVRDWVKAKGVENYSPVVADSDAVYRSKIEINVSKLEPTVAVPPSPANGQPVSQLAGVKVDQVYIGNCSNGTLTDLRQAAEILSGRKVAAGVRVYVVPATQAIYSAAADEGLIGRLSEAGATILPPTCGACFGGHMGILASGEVAVGTTNRNFRGRMGHPDAKVYLASAWVAAAAALTGELVHPQSINQASV